MQVKGGAGFYRQTGLAFAAGLTIDGSQTVEGLGENAGSGGLAGATGAAEQVGMLYPIVADCVAQCGDDVLLTPDLTEAAGSEPTVERRVLPALPSLQPGRDTISWRTAEGVGFEPTVTVKPHTLSKRAESAALASLPGPTPGWVPGDKGIVAPHPFWSVAVGSCATGAREPGQGRKAAALSGTPGVPQTTWPPLSRTGVVPRGAYRRRHGPESGRPGLRLRRRSDGIGAGRSPAGRRAG